MCTKCPWKPGEEVGVSGTAVLGGDKLSDEDARILRENSVCT